MQEDETRLRSKARVLQKSQIDELLALPVLARMATVSNGHPHVVPVWFDWDGEYLWITADKAHKKIKHLRNNPNLAVSIDESLGGLRFWAILMEGMAELIKTPKDLVVEMTERIYVKYMGKGVMDLPTLQVMLFGGDSILIKLKPTRIVSWYAVNSGIGPIG